MPPQRRVEGPGSRPHTRSQTVAGRKTPERKTWEHFNPTREEIESHTRTLDLDRDFDAVSALSDLEKATTWERRSAKGKRASVVKGAARLARMHVRKAQTHAGTIQMKSFSLAEAVKTPHGRPENVVEIEPPGPTTILRGDKPSRLKSADEFDIFYHLPGGLEGKNLAELFEAATAWGHVCKPSKSVSNDKKGGYKEAGELVGTTRIVLAWHAIGHPHDVPGVCADILRNRLTFNGACELLEKLDVVNSYVMALIKAIDPEQHRSLEELYKWRINKFASSRALCRLTEPELFYEGREIQFNRYSRAHWDNQDPHWAWAIIIYFGTFGTCRLKFKQLRTEVVLRPGDAVAIRGQDILHEASDWDFGERHLIVHFTHRALWAQAGLVCKTSPAAPFSD